MQRVIALIDLDFFYAQCEIIKNPSLKNTPVVVYVPSLRPDSGAIASVSYEARALKVKAGMPLQLAKKLAPTADFVVADFPYYDELSEKVFDIVDYFGSVVEKVSIDEAYIDFTAEGIEKAQEICVEMRKRILIETNIQCTIGIASNKLLSKMACDSAKPNGFLVLTPEKEKSFLHKQKITDVFGVGPKTEEILKKFGVRHISDVTSHSQDEFVRWLGEAKGIQLFNFFNGVDDRVLEPNREKKQLMRIMTLAQDSSDFDYLSKNLSMLCDAVYSESKKLEKSFKTISLVSVNPKLDSSSKSFTFKQGITSVEQLKEQANLLLNELLREGIIFRRIGIRLSNLSVSEGFQKKLFEF
jgi:DNA polymerase IV (DinB-like DNA polymerase)